MKYIFILITLLLCKGTFLAQERVKDSLEGFNIADANLEAKIKGVSQDEYDFFINKKKREYIISKFNLKSKHSPYIEKYQSTSNTFSATNIDFEAGNLSGWSISSGFNSNSLNIDDSGFPSSSGISVAISAGTDAIVGLPIVSPFGGNWVARINYTVTGVHQEKIKNKINVTATDNLLKFAYATVLNKAQHECESQPFFAVLLKDTLGNILFKYFVEAPDSGICKGYNQTNFNNNGLLLGTYNAAFYNNWDVKCVDLTPYIGTNIYIEVVSGACTLSGHWGYGYFDAKLETCPQYDVPNILTIGSQSLSLNQNFIYYQSAACPSSITVSAPSWPSYYNWNGPSGSNVYTTSFQSINSSYSGLYTLSMGNNSVCPVTKSIYIETGKFPILSISPTTFSVCQNDSFTLTANGANTYTWSNGFIGSSIVLTPTAIGISTISVTGANSLGCLGSPAVSLSYTVNGLPILSVSGNTNICSGNSSTFVASGATSYTWTWDNGASTSTGSTIITPTLLTTNVFTLVGSNGNCQTTKIFSVAISPSVTSVLASITSTNLCSGNSSTLTVNYAQTLPPNTFSVISSSTFTAPSLTNIILTPTTTTSYSILAYNACGYFSKTFSINVSSSTPTITYSPIAPYCSDSYSFNLGGANNYTITSPYTWAGSFTTNLSTATLNPYLYPGYLTLSGSYSNSACIDTKTFNINAFTPTLNLSLPNNFCSSSASTVNLSGGGIIYTITPMSSYTSAISSSYTVASTFTIVPPINLQGFSVQSYDGSGCLASEFLSATSISPTINITSSSNTLCFGQSATLTALGAINYTWSNGSTSYSTIVSPTATSIYSVVGYANGCGNSSNTYTLSYNPLTVNSVSLTPSSYTPCSATNCTITPSGGVSYTWVPTPAFLVGGNAIYTNLTSPNIYTYSIRYTDLNGCKSFTTISITPFSPTLSILGGDTVCGLLNTFTATGANNYTWTVFVPLSGTNSLTGTSYTLSTPSSFGLNTSFTLTGTDLNNCKAKMVKSIYSYGNVSVLTSSLATVCNNTNDTLKAIAPLTISNYTWSTGAISNSIVVAPTITTVYSVQTKYNSFGCVAKGTKTVNVFPIGAISFTLSSNTACEGDPPITLLISSPTTAYSYSDGFTNNNSFYPFSAGVHTLYCYYTDLNNCINKTAIQSITVNPKPLVTISNSLTNFCLNSGTIALIGNPSGGNFSGFNVFGSNYNTSNNSSSSVIYNYTGTNGCTNYDQKCFEVSICTGINATDFLNSISVYPNPFNSSFYIENNYEKDLFITITDISGKLFYSEKVKSSCNITPEQLPSGMYFLKLSSSSEQKTFKLIKN